MSIVDYRWIVGSMSVGWMVALSTLLKIINSRIRLVCACMYRLIGTVLGCVLCARFVLVPVCSVLVSVLAVVCAVLFLLPVLPLTCVSFAPSTCGRS